MNDDRRPPSLAEQLAAPGGRTRALDRAAEEVMTPGVVAFPVTASLDRTAQAMAHHNVHGVLVMTCDGKPAGWVTIEAITPRRGQTTISTGRSMRSASRTSPCARAARFTT